MALPIVLMLCALGLVLQIWMAALDDSDGPPSPMTWRDSGDDRV